MPGYILQVTLRSSRCGYVVQGASIQKVYENKEIGKTKGKREMEPAAETRIRVRASHERKTNFNNIYEMSSVEYE